MRNYDVRRYIDVVGDVTTFGRPGLATVSFRGQADFRST
jgi:hypothetical protein